MYTVQRETYELRSAHLKRVSPKGVIKWFPTCNISEQCLNESICFIIILYKFILQPFSFSYILNMPLLYCKEGGGGKSELMYSNKYPINLKKSSKSESYLRSSCSTKEMTEPLYPPATIKLFPWRVQAWSDRALERDVRAVTAPIMQIKMLIKMFPQELPISFDIKTYKQMQEPVSSCWAKPNWWIMLQCLN